MQEFTLCIYFVNDAAVRIDDEQVVIWQLTHFAERDRTLTADVFERQLGYRRREIVGVTEHA